MKVYSEYSANINIITIYKNNIMLTTIATILLILWLLGLVTGYTLGYFIHVLLVVAIIMFLVRIIQGKNPIQ